jgi:hypothetical protein
MKMELNVILNYSTLGFLKIETKGLVFVFKHCHNTLEALLGT